MKSIRLFVFFFLILSGSLCAQSDFRLGYIITNDQDTVYGKIDYRGDQMMASVCRFSAKDKSEIKEYAPQDLIGFRFIDSKKYVSKEISAASGNRKVFLEYLIKGKMNVFYYRDEKGDNYFVEKEGGDLVLLPYKEEEILINSTPYLSKSQTHIGILRSLTKDAPSTFKRLEHFEKPGHKNLINFAEQYHYEVCKDEDCIVYEKKEPLLKLSLEPLIGTTKFKGTDGWTSEAGTHLFIWLPRANEKLYFKSGILFSRFTVEGAAYKVYKVPIQIQYLYPHKIFQPKFNFGGNFYTLVRNNGNTHRLHTLHIGTGFHLNVYKNLALSTNINSELTPLSSGLLLEDSRTLEPISYSLNLGAFIRF